MSFSKKYKFSGILLAAGRGSRFDKKFPKQFTEIKENTTVLEESFKLLSLFTNKIILALPAFSSHEKEIINLSHKIIQKIEIFAAEKKIILKKIIGGVTRQESVKLAFQELYKIKEKKEKINNKLDQLDQYVLIHDAARCFCHFRDIKNLVKEVQKKKAVILAKKAIDTIKIADHNLKIINTPKRSQVWHAQTPQAFEIKILQDAFQEFKDQNYKLENLTDDSSLLEKVNKPVYLLESKYSNNLKITYKQDLENL